jgi:hypothetical protein
MALRRAGVPRAGPGSLNDLLDSSLWRGALGGVVGLGGEPMILP